MSKSDQEITAHATIRDLAHHEFMNALYNGLLHPAQLVSQRELCELLEVPMGPMREALKRLEGEGIVTHIPQRGVRILDIDEKTINDAFQMRLILEVEAVKHYSLNGDLEPVQGLRNRTQELATKAPDSDQPFFEAVKAQTTLDHEMHRLFVSSLDNRFATEMIDRVLSRLRLSRLVFRLRNYSDRNAVLEHLDILDAVLSREAQSAANAMEHHLKTSWQRALGIPHK